MQTIKEIITEKLGSSIRNEDILNWYIIYCYEFSEVNGQTTENHHILPRKLFPDYQNLNKNPWNSAKLPKDSHLIAHYLLFKAINNKSITFAFNMMRRNLKGESGDIYNIAKLYKEAKDEIAKLMSDINKGKKYSPERCKQISEKNKGTVVVYDKDNPEIKFRVNVTDEKYVSGQFVHVATGRVHKAETKAKMSLNGIKGKRAVTLKSGAVIFTEIGECVLEDCVVGNKNPNISNAVSNKMTKAAHYHNPETNETARFQPGDDIPLGFIKGRLNFDNVFSRGSFYKNFKTQEVGQSKTDNYSQFCGSTTAKNAFLYKGKYTFDVYTLVKAYPNELTLSLLHGLTYKDRNRKIYHHKSSKEIQEFLKQFTYYSEIPIQILKIQDVIDLITLENWL